MIPAEKEMLMEPHSRVCPVILPHGFHGILSAVLVELVLGSVRGEAAAITVPDCEREIPKRTPNEIVRSMMQSRRILGFLSE